MIPCHEFHGGGYRGNKKRKMNEELKTKLREAIEVAHSCNPTIEAILYTVIATIEIGSEKELLTHIIPFTISQINACNNEIAKRN